MKSLDIKYFDIAPNQSMEFISKELSQLESVIMDQINWTSFDYLPNVSFQIAYSSSALYIKYNVTEQAILARKSSINDPVFKDSCVEIFIEPDGDKYYNFEFNCIGTPYGGVGRDRTSGKPQDVDTIKSIRTLSSLGSEPFEEVLKESSWTLTVEIPFKAFTSKSIDQIKGSSMRANLYKCGDELTTPHFVTWNSIDTENPDFHRPEFFGVINFK